ncbi:ArsR family transcriptional regulator [Fischerella thermalis CCMEE 5268]|uniref:ArsR family transcriptional regulator n=1 Tax=Fischerella thermalis CCMEE 5268 TaxID=2019662 RepID=A0A2N6KG83_9CYAN|nr:metalloregulator ArsR/SmtB family transcription factor [Fischerella thermalis]PLZ98181.1 ArsR family transcriptional regulator [Fischerella thermalis CCMEE 5268]
MKTEQFQIVLRFFKALADESRLKILSFLANQECSVEELAVLLQLKEPTVSHHLAKLREVNLVTMRPEGNTHLYQLESGTLESVSKEILTPGKIASWVEDVDTEAWEIKIIQTYTEGERLKEIPSSRKKRLVILRWLANKFEVGVQYSESTIDEILKRYHPDFGNLRRELISYNLIQKKDGAYYVLDGRKANN